MAKGGEAGTTVIIDGQSSIRLYRSIFDVPAVWETLAPVNNAFLQRPYLSVLEANPPSGMQFAYLVFYRYGTPVGIAITQIQFFKANQNIKQNDAPVESNKNCLTNKMGNFLKNRIAKRIAFHTLVCGNLLLTGEHGYYFPDLPHPQPEEAVSAGLKAVLPVLERQGIQISALLIKDIFEENRSTAGQQFNKTCHEFTIDPNMIMTIPQEWETVDDYHAAMSSKYRTRRKRALKKAKDIKKVELDTEGIEREKTRLYELYLKIASGSDFNAVILDDNYMLALKQTFPDDFKLTAYYLENELIGYYTTIKNYDELEAHFLGFDPAYNRDYQIYLNILYDIVSTAIEVKAHHIVFARTATEIKSSVGAVPVEMYCYARHRSRLSNKILQPMVEYLQPKRDTWVIRRPFK